MKRITIFLDKTKLVALAISLTLCYFDGFSQDKLLSGYVVDSFSKEPLIGVSIRSGLQGVQSNEYGYFSIRSKQSDTLILSSVGYKTDTLLVFSNGVNNIGIKLNLLPIDISLEAVIVSPPKRNLTGGRLDITARDIKKMPLIFGEKDPIKAILFMPGVQSGTEGTNSFFVRGGNTGENLLLLDEATVYNANHLFGFFSVFNVDAIKGIKFFKGNFPAQFGGRTSSVIDIHTKEGNMKTWQGSGGISFISSRLNIEGPIVKDKLSLSVSGRRTYLDGLLALFQQSNSDKFFYDFYDLNGKIKWQVSPTSTLLFSAYNGKDDLTNRFSRNITIDGASGTETQDSFLRWGNQTYSLRFNQILGKNVFSKTSLIYSSYYGENTADTRVKSGSFNSVNLRSIDSALNEKTVKTDLTWSPKLQNELSIGFWYSDFLFNPKIERALNTELGIDQTDKLTYHGTNVGVYIEESRSFGERLSSKLGIRAHGLYTPNKNYFMLEPRLSLSYALKNKGMLTADYSRMNQFINQIQSTSLGLSTDLWFIATDKIPPSGSDLYSLSYSKSFKSDWVFRAEGYFRRMHDVSNLSSENSFFLLNEELNIDDDISEYIATGEGIAGGAEFLIKKDGGRLNGFSSLTLSRVIYRVEGENRSLPFLPLQDRPVNFNTVVNYQLKKHIRLSGTWVYFTAPLIRSPEAYSRFKSPIFDFNSIEEYMILGNINKSRGKDYHRLDLSISFDKKKKRYFRVIEIGVYNIYYRRNPIFFNVQRASESGTGKSILRLQEVALLPIIPFISYNFTF